MPDETIMTAPDTVDYEKSQVSPRESVRLVIWDLDETFWEGTLTEGGIRAYVQAHHDIVVELARRGIMSSICSKNDFSPVVQILSEKGILDYFIFPSISWDSKGPRLAALVEAVQLRPATVMFIDDNPSNRAEAAAFVPDLQLADETFVTRMLLDPRFKGKDDPRMTRLAQYKLLESRKQDEGRAGGDNAAFLRGCDVRVHIEHDVASHLDRAIELINRTNQLNYTKNRLPEDATAARELLLQQSREAGCQAGLIRVIDRYGDYGFVGFFMLRNGRRTLSPDQAGQTLVHYCFSCRTLGMLVEYWLYDLLRRPELDISGEVLTDLAQPRVVDWIRLVSSPSEAIEAAAPIAPEIRVHGGCEANAVAHYLAARCKTTKVTGNFAAGAFFVRVNSGSLLLSSCDHAGGELENEAASLGIPPKLLAGDFFQSPEAGTLFVFSGGLDAGDGEYRYRHRRTGLELRLEINGNPALNFVAASEEEIRKIETSRFANATSEHVGAVVRHIRDEYETVSGVGAQGLPAMMAELFDRIPEGSRLIILLDDPRMRGGEGVVSAAPWITRYNEQVKSLAEAFDFVDVVSFADAIRSEDEIQVGGNHYDRMVYCRSAEAIIAAVGRIPAKTYKAGAAREKRQEGEAARTSQMKKQRTLVFCTAFVGNPKDPYYSWNQRYRIWVEAVRRSGLEHAQILLVDDGSASLPEWRDATLLQEGDDLRCDAPLVIYHFKERLGRKAVSDFPGWVRSFFFVSHFANANGFDKIVHLEADAFLISQAACRYVDAVTDGWLAMWCPRYNRPESGIQVIAGAGLETYRKWAAKPVGDFTGQVIEKTLPFSHLCRTLTGDRYGESDSHYVPKDADWCMQAHPPVNVAPTEYFWWMDWFDTVFPGSPQGAREAEIIEHPSASLAHEGMNYLSWLKQAEQVMQPSMYLEIGTHTGDSIKMISCDAVCVDPRFAITSNVLMGRRNTHFFQGISDAFFADPAALGRLFPAGADLAFLDGLHLYEVLLRDFMHTENIMNQSGMILIHDCLPLNGRMAERTQNAGGEDEPAWMRDFWTGDVWKIVVVLAKYRPDLAVSYLDCGPSGLVACTGLKRGNTVLADQYDKIVGEFAELTLAGYGIEKVWDLFPTYRSAQVVASRENFRKALYRTARKTGASSTRALSAARY